MENFSYIIPDEHGFKETYFDELLSAGFYRMQHFMFTCNATMLDEEERMIPVFWLRTLVQQYKLSTSAKTIIKSGAVFSIDIQPAFVNQEVEDLYAIYKAHVSFAVSATCTDYLHHSQIAHPFKSLIVQVRHASKLVAVGYFDAGLLSIAGIMNIYHPQYQKYSLGKLLLLQKLKYALEHNMPYYYTGYISPDSPRFDYKTFPDPSAVELLLPDKQQWINFKWIDTAYLRRYYLTYLCSANK